MKNVAVAEAILQSLWSLGVREVVLCAGARNAPFVSLLSRPGPLRVYSFFEERSAGFFALGRMQAGGAPVAVITTSGTAAAELLPSAIEADFQGLPLIMVTADRPRRYRGSGAPQSIEQLGLYSHYVERTWDVEGEWSGEVTASLRRPLHFNVCFAEPLIDLTAPEFLPHTSTVVAKERPPAPDSGFAPPPSSLAMQRPLILVGALPQSEVGGVLAWLRNCRRPIYLEAPSQLRGHPDLSSLECKEGEKRLALENFDGVIRLGGIPTLRLWRDLEASHLPVAHFSHLPFSGMPRVRPVFALRALATVQTKFEPCLETASVVASPLSALLERYPLSEPAWVSWLSRQLPENARLFLGNSLPIREWDLAASRDVRAEIFVNRGVNGIDGLVSTFLGVAAKGASNWALLGDLSALYDLSGPWAARTLGIEELNLVILNNGGGKIFKNIFHQPLFENQHEIGFAAWAKMWSWDYERLEAPRLLSRAQRPRVIEILPSEQQSEAFWEAYT